MALIELDRVSLTFHVREQRQLTLKEYILKGMYLRRRNPLIEVRALREVSLRIGEGERVGVVGGNGSGKSTLLRLLADIYAPTAGRRRVRGKISSLFDLTLGFEMEATGRKNIFYRGYLQGETRRSIQEKAAEIAAFCDLGHFLDIPVRYYSAGMMVRLGFSIATAINPEILLVDEILGAGDLAFQRKARQRLQGTMSHARILVVVSHDLDLIAQLCDRAIWLDHGRVQADGPAAEVVAAYVEHVQGHPAAPAEPEAVAV